MSTEKIRSIDVAAELEKTRGLERDYIGELITSRKRAWQVCLASCVLTIAAIGAVAGLTPLKQPPEIYVVRVDNATGNIEHVSELGEPFETYNERIDKYFLNTYVLNCEGYNWQTIQSQFNTCALLSSPPIQNLYGKRFEGDYAPTTRLGQLGNIDVIVHSITLGENQTATIRFSTTEKEASTNQVQSQRHLIATVAYQYIKVPLTEEVARRNPLGFQITRYDLAADLSR